MRKPNPSEPANYTGSYTTVRKEIEDTEIAMYQSADRVIIDTIDIVSRTTITITTTTAMQMLCLLKPRVSEEQEGGLRN
jgi:hypothetical protein